MDNTQFLEVLNQNSELKKDLFIRGFLISREKIDGLEDFPFYGNWKVKEVGGYFFMAHELTGMHILEEDGKVFYLMGHAYNPFTMEYEEEKILSRLAKSYGTENYIDCINELTGVFVYGSVVDGKIEFFVDPSGMQSAYYGKIKDNFYISSHAQLIGDVCNLEMDEFVKKLINYKWYGRILGPYLPADLTPFSEVKRIVPNQRYEFKDEVKHERFWPLKEQSVAIEKEDYDAVIKKAADIIKNNMQLISQKWNRPWISLTGGIDSNTTFAAANGLYEKFETFSYISAEKEIRDAEAAKKIAEHFKVKHHEYFIPEENNKINKLEERKALFEHNKGYVAKLYDNELRKKLYLRDNMDIDVEVKSWVSETIRGYWYKYLKRKKMPKLSAKLFRNLYKIFTTDRKLAHEIDKIFEQYIKDFEYEKIPKIYPPADMHYNEVSWGSWGGLNITEMKYDFDITFAYNNRIFLDTLFRVPLEKRISDEHHLDMKKYLNPELFDMGIRVVNMKETAFRAKALNAIFTINSVLP